MAKSAKATQAKEKEEAPEKEEGASDTPLPLLDLNDAGVKKMIKAAKKRGYVTIDQINQVMPSGEVSSTRSRTSTRCSTRSASTSSRPRKSTTTPRTRTRLTTTMMIPAR